MKITWPIGTQEQRDLALTGIPKPWNNSNPYMNKYRFGYHTGADFNLDEPHWNYDAGQPVYMPFDGQVVSSRIGAGKTWGWEIVTVHNLEGITAYTRLAHVDHKTFNVPKVGDLVLCGQQVARVGNADGYYSPGGDHLHFDISLTGILGKDPSDWPGLNRTRLLRDYVDPVKLIINLLAGKKATGQGTFPHTGSVLYAKGGNRLRDIPSLKGRVMYVIPNNGAVTMTSDSKYDEDGWIWIKVSYKNLEGYIAYSNEAGTSFLLSS